MNEVFRYDLVLAGSQIKKVIELSRLLDLTPGKLIIKALERGLLELRKDNKGNYKRALYRALEETEERLRDPLWNLYLREEMANKKKPVCRQALRR